MSPEPSEKNAGLRANLPRIAARVGIGLLGVLVVAAAVALYFTSKPSFYLRYDAYKNSYNELQSSAHAGIKCDQCHTNRSALLTDAALVADYYRGMVGKPYAPTFYRLATPTRAACLTCHLYDWSTNASQTAKVPHPAHLAVKEETRDCVLCHRWVGHEETYMQQHKKMPFSVVCASFECHVGVKPAKDCQNCHHQLQPSLASWRQTHPEVVRTAGPNGCLEICHTADQCRLCHTTGKTPVFAATIKQSPGVQVIEAQHVQPNWIDRHGTFALQDKSKCLVCHVSEGECQNCHAIRPAFHGSQQTWLSAHQPLAKKNKQRCLTCHQQSFCDNCHQQFKEMR